MKRITKLFLGLAACVGFSLGFTSCLSTSIAAPVSNEINKVTFCDPETSVAGSKSFSLKLDEVDADGKVVVSNVIFPTMVTFSSSYHKRDINVKEKMFPGKLYKVVIESPNDATPIEISGVDANNTFKAAGGYDYNIEYYGKVTNSDGKKVHTFKVVKVRN